MHPFEDLESVHSALQRLSKREPPLVTVLPRQAGTKEARYAHLMGETPPVADMRGQGSKQQMDDVAESVHSSREAVDVEDLVHEVAQLRAEISELRAQFATFRKQFD
jgi:hypothetical protein